jgi:hypothetical protein
MVKLKEVDKMNGNLKNSMKSSFWSSCFSSYKYSIPKIIKNTILIQNFIFLSFRSLIRERRESGQISIEEREENLG